MQNTKTKTKQRCGFVSILGRPNVGKSTLLNYIVGQKISITSRKPQTTRHTLLGIKTDKQSQIIFVDTPGLQIKPERAINRYMNRAVYSALDVDLVLFMVEAGRWLEADDNVVKQLEKIDQPVFLVINKIDRLKHDQKRLLDYIQAMAHKMKFADIFPISAIHEDSHSLLKEKIISRLPIADFIYPDDYITDRSSRFMAAELIREKLMRRLGDELPYRLTVEVEHFVSDPDCHRISAIIWVERAGQKSIVIGKQGKILKSVGSQARIDMEKLFNKKVYLKTWVKVKANWSDDERALKRMGYDE